MVIRRMTKMREALLAIFRRARHPLSAQDLSGMLISKKIAVDRVTLYRQLRSMVQDGVLEEVARPGSTMMYESAGPHHHHLRCRNCGTLEDLELDASTQLESLFHRLEGVLERKTRYTDIRHGLEFSGMCVGCRS